MKEIKINDLSNNINQLNKIQINKGIQILRMLLAYLILEFHCYNIKHTKLQLIIVSYRVHIFCVPTFYVISYYFSYKILKLKNINKIQLRIKKIIIPYIIWPIIFFLINNNFSIKNLCIQLLIGKRIYNVLWFQCILIFSFIFLSIITLSLRHNFVYIIQLVGISGYIYINLNNNFYMKYNSEIKILIEDFFRGLFFATIGISISFFGGINYFKINRKKSILFSLFILFLIKDFFILINKYHYLRNLILGLVSISLFILFSTLSSDNNNNKFLNKIIIQITNYTGGIYYLHYKIRDILSHILIIIKNKTLFGCIINYIICYFICFMGFKAFKKTNLKYLFI